MSRKKSRFLRSPVSPTSRHLSPMAKEGMTVDFDVNFRNSRNFFDDLKRKNVTSRRDSRLLRISPLGHFLKFDLLVSIIVNHFSLDVLVTISKKKLKKKEQKKERNESNDGWTYEIPIIQLVLDPYNKSPYYY